MELDEISFKLGEIDSTVKATHDDVLDLKKWLIAHEATDKREFTSVRDDIKNINKYASSIAVVAAFIGAGCMALKDKILGKS